MWSRDGRSIVYMSARGGTENLPAILGMAAALEQARGWMREAARRTGFVSKVWTPISRTMRASPCICPAY